MKPKKPILVFENTDKFSYEVTFIPGRLNKRLRESLDGTCRALASDIAFQVRERFIPLHKSIHSLRAVVNFVADLLNELRKKAKDWELGQRAILTIEPNYRELFMSALVLDRGERKCFIAGRRIPSILNREDPLEVNGIELEASAPEEVCDFHSLSNVQSGKFTGNEFLKLRGDLRKRMKKLGLRDANLRDHFQVPTTQMCEIMNRPFNKRGQATKTGFMMVYNYVLSVEKQVHA